MKLNPHLIRALVMESSYRFSKRKKKVQLFFKGEKSREKLGKKGEKLGDLGVCLYGTGQKERTN